MSESGDYDPGPWRGHNFNTARKQYDSHVGRSYDNAVEAHTTCKQIIEPKLITQSESPLVIACDVTGSMGDWPATIFSKLPYLDLEGQEYLGKTLEISFAAVGDAYSDKYPLQVRPFTKGTDMKKRLEELVIEGNGGGQGMESYDLPAVYYANNVEMPKAIRPIFIYIGDEGIYDFVDKGFAKEYANVNLDKRLKTTDAIRELKNKFSVYLIRKPYDEGYGDKMGPRDQKIYAQWESVLGADHISQLPGADRVVDVIFGILARETNRMDYFQEELVGRQTKTQVDTVMKALDSLHTPDTTDSGYFPSPASVPKVGQSVMRRRTTGNKTKPLA